MLLLGRKLEQPFNLVQTIPVIFAGKVGHTTLGVMGHGAAQIFKGDFFAGDAFDDVRAGDEHVRGVLYHENEISHGRRINRAPAVGPMMAEIWGMTPEETALR